MPERPSCKAQLRTTMRQRRQALSPAAQSLAADTASGHFRRLPHWPTASRIALYHARDGEIDTAPLCALCRTSGKQLFLPVIDGQNLLSFAEWTEDSELSINRYGIPEPPPAAGRCTASELDIIVVPLVAWDRQGGRLGMGGGYYDRALAGIEQVLLVGLAHALQEVPQVPRDDWDVPLNFVVTDTALHRCGGDDQGPPISPG